MNEEFEVGSARVDAGNNRLDAVLAEAKKRFDRVAEFEAPFRARFIDDIKFANADSENGYQWPNAIRRNRDTDNRPCLTMNVVRQHNFQISNEARKNKSSPTVVPMGDGASKDSANAMRDLLRHIETKSRAQLAYTRARNFQIDGGIGWWRLATDYVDTSSMDQEIQILPVHDPLSIYMDPDIKYPDGSDARFALVFDNVPTEEWDNEYPDFADIVGHQPLSVGASDDDWVSRHHIRVCEYFRKVKTRDKLISFIWEGSRKNVKKSELPQGMDISEILNAATTRTREIENETIEWFLIAGNQIVDQTIWPGKYIPLVRCIGEEYVIEGILDRKGHTRSMKDSQRMYNYNASAQVEFVALQGKTPWVAPAKAIEEYESMWNTANMVNHSVLIWNHLDDDANPIPPPMRTQPPTASPAYQVAMDTAFNQMMMVSGQWQNQMGMMGNERTGKAIALRQEQGDTATFHFQDNYESALVFTATQIIDLVPKIYDTKRVINVMAENGETFELQIDPKAKKAYELTQASNAQAAMRVFNPQFGLYDVAPSFGPSFASKQDQTADALTLILTQAPTLVPVLGDLLVGSLPFDRAKEAEQRLKRLVPPMALGEGPSPTEQQLGAQAQTLQKALAESLEKQAKTSIKLEARNQLRDIDVYKAETDRMGQLKEFLPAEPEALRAMIRDLVKDALATDLLPIIRANSNNIDLDNSGKGEPQASSALDEIAPPGAKRGRDGQYYLPDPNRPGKFMKVTRKGAV